jgi:hypothetical protein
MMSRKNTTVTFDLPAMTPPIDDSMLPLDDQWLDLGPFEMQWLTIEYDAALLPEPFPELVVAVDAVPQPLDITLEYDPRWLDLETGQPFVRRSGPQHRCM